MNRKIAAILSIFCIIFMGALSVQAVNWPLRVSAGGKYLEDQDGVPFPIVGEAAWSMAAQLSPPDVIVYLNDRQAKGFTAIMVSAVEHQFASNAPRNYNNQHPFVGGDADWSVRNENYWSHLDFILNEAKNRNILVFLFPAYIGFECGDQGWCAEMRSQTDAEMTGYGEWLGNRYANQGNIVWVHGGDANANSFAGAYSRVAAIANGIKSKDSNHLHTAHSAPERSAVDDYALLIDLNTTYSYSDPQGEIQRDYQRVSALPFSYIEGAYENEHASTAIDWQGQALTAYLGGALLGHFFGNCPIWHFGGYPSYTCELSDWKAQLDSTGSKSLGNIGSLMKSREWWKFEPDYQNTVVTSGKGSGAGYKAAARASDGRTVMVWFPDASQATVDLSKISGQQAKAYWWNPNDNTSTLIGIYATTASLTFSPSSLGRVLIIDVENGGLCAPGQPSANFFGNPTSGPYPHTVTFTDESTGNPTSWDWDFGDGNKSNQQNPTNTYHVAGTYTVSVKVTDNSSCTDTETKAGYITVVQQTDKKRIYPHSEIRGNGTVNGDFLDTINSDNISESITEAISSGQIKKRTSYLEHKWIFSVPQGNSLKFFLEAGRSENSDGDNFIFAYSTDDMNYDSLAVVTNSADQIYSAALPSSISGTVYVRVTDANRSLGNISIDTIYVDELYFEIDYIPASLLANFSGNPTSGMVPLTVDFRDQSTGNPLTWHWNFGDGQTSNEQNPIHTYEKVGTYSVSMTAQNEYGSNTIEKVNFINASQGGGLTIYVSSTVVMKKVAGKNQFGQAVVTVTDMNGLPVAGAVVYGFFNYPNSTIKSGMTGPNGVTTISSDKANNVVEFCFGVTDVVLSGANYSEVNNSCAYWCENGCGY